MKTIIRLISVAALLVVGVGNAWGTKSYTLVTNISSLSTNDYVVILDVDDASDLASANGVTGWDTSKDATISTSGWKEYKVTKGVSTFTLYDEDAEAYIATPTGNHFKYDATAGDCSVDEDGWLICNSRYLAINGSNYRFYETSNSYPAFFVWKVGALTPHTITFNAGNGGCGTSTSGSVTSYTLPSATPSASCESEGWVFAGWKESSAQAETTSFPVLYAAGTTYSPATDITLYAVYYQPSTSYKKITSTDYLLKGCNYVFGHEGSSSDYYVFKAEIADGSYIGTVDDVIPSTNTISNPDATLIWELKGSQNAWQLYNSDAELYIRVGTSPFLYISGENIVITYSSSAFILSNGNKDLVFYSDHTLGGKTEGTAKYHDIYRQQGTFNTNPSCCDKVVEVSAGTKTHVSTIAFDITEVPTCGDGEDDRKVTITVTPSSGYTFNSTSRLEYSGDGTAAYVSGPTDNGNGTYSFVYQFEVDDDGSGTFAATAGRFTNYRTQCCDDPALTFGTIASPVTDYEIVREDLASASTAVEIDVDYESLNTSTSVTWYSTKRNARTFVTPLGAYTWTSPTSQPSEMQLDIANKKISAATTGVYVIKIKQESENVSGTVYCEKTAAVTVTVKTVDKFVDAVNGNFSGEPQRLEDVGGGILLPTEATFSTNDACHLPTRRLLGWIKASDLETYRTAGNTGYIDSWKTGDASNKVIAPGTRVEATGITWYAVWGEEVTP